MSHEPEEPVVCPECQRRGAGPCHRVGEAYFHDPVEPQLRQRDGDQPLPVRNDETDIQSLVIVDIQARREVGIQRYGTALQPANGRDSLRDAYEEVLDLACYLRQAIEERDRLKMSGFPS